jgi:hypothetical protein
MSDTPTAVEVNCETGEVTTRPLTAAEIKVQADAAKAVEAQRVADEKAASDKAAAKAALLAKLGITEEEAALLA